MNNNRKWLAAALALTLSAAVFSSGCGGEIKAGTAPAALVPAEGFSVATADAGSRSEVHEAMGTVRARVSAVVSAKVMGNVEQALVKEGDLVKAGQTLAVIEPTQVNAAAEQARAAAAAAQAQATLAEATYRRFQGLREREAVSAQEFEEVEARYRQATAAARQAGAAVRAASSVAGDARVTAPFDGRVASRSVEPGDLAAPGRPLFVVEQESGHRAEFDAPESLVSGLVTGATVEVVVPALANARLSGTLVAVSPAADERSHSFLVKVDLPADDRLKSGMFCRVLIPSGESNYLAAPAAAIVTRGQLTGIYLVDEDGAVHFRLVRVGRELGDRVEVISGLKSGDRFVVNPGPTLRDGARVL